MACSPTPFLRAARVAADLRAYQVGRAAGLEPTARVIRVTNRPPAPFAVEIRRNPA